MFEEKGMILSGVSPDGSLVEVVEIDKNDFFVAAEYHPEFLSRPNRPHPLFVGLAKASRRGNMVKINSNYLNLEEGYLFSTIAKKVKVYKEKHPDKRVISLGIGDVVLPLSEPVINALKKGVEEMANKDSFKGYGPEQGYYFLREGIREYYSEFGVKLDDKSIF